MVNGPEILPVKHWLGIEEDNMEIVISILALLVSAYAVFHSVRTRESVGRLSAEEKRTKCLAELYGMHARYCTLTQSLIEVKKGMHPSRKKEHTQVKEVLEGAYREIDEIAAVQKLIFDEEASAVEIEKLRPRIEGMKLKQQGFQEDYESLKQFKSEPGVY